MASHDPSHLAQPPPTSTDPRHPPSDSRPVELTTLPPSSPLSPATETFATPPTSARQSTYGPAIAHANGVTSYDTVATSNNEHTHTTAPAAATATAATSPADDPVPTTAGQQEHEEDATKHTHLTSAPSTTTAGALTEKSDAITTTSRTGGIGPAASQSALHLPSATDDPTDPTADDTVVHLTLLHPSGLRHPFILNPAYLTRHNIPGDNPWSISVYTLKELIWRDWRAEWEERPTTPGAVRLISFGRLLDDRAILQDLKFSHSSANVVHMTVRPADLEEDEGSAKKGRRRRGSDGEGGDGGGGGGGGCCRCCCVM